MKIVLLVFSLLIAINSSTMFGQTLPDPKYHKEDSLFIEYMRTFRGITDEEKLSIISIIRDTMNKIHKERHVKELLFAVPDNEMPYELKKVLDSIRSGKLRDTFDSKKHGIRRRDINRNPNSDL
jgi:hypothetical protein